MGKISSDFERFLYANYPDDYMRATAEDVPDDVITAILSRHNFHYGLSLNNSLAVIIPFSIYVSIINLLTQL